MPNPGALIEDSMLGQSPHATELHSPYASLTRCNHRERRRIHKQSRSPFRHRRKRKPFACLKPQAWKHPERKTKETRIRLHSPLPIAGILKTSLVSNAWSSGSPMRERRSLSPLFCCTNSLPGSSSTNSLSSNPSLFAIPFIKFLNK